MSPDDSDQLTRSLRSDCKVIQSMMESMLLKILVSSCLVPRPHYSARPKRFGSHGPSENVRPSQKSSKVRQLNRDGKQDQCFAFQG